MASRPARALHRMLVPLAVPASVCLSLCLSVTPAGAQTDRLDLKALGRPAEEVTRDATSKPLAVYEFFEIRPGATGSSRTGS